MREQFLALTDLSGETIFVRADAITAVQDSARGARIATIADGERLVRESPATILALPINAAMTASRTAQSDGEAVLFAIENWVRQGERTELAPRIAAALDLPGIPPWFPSETELRKSPLARAHLIFRAMQLRMIEEATA